MKSEFREGDRVVLKQDYPGLLMAGSVGVVWAQYATEPAAYEVTFTGADGKEFDLTLSEEEIATPMPLTATSEAA